MRHEKSMTGEIALRADTTPTQREGFKTLEVPNRLDSGGLRC